ncbi:unnamed protein product [Clavelina lepadiformis]|uniref:Protein kinase domain-containing protein n=1 Tax=Clavelina lepadiformis TaxID=159417 RepID=A0ABP0GH90_CLALP
MASARTSSESTWGMLPCSSRKYIDEIPPDQRANLCTEIDYTIHKNEGYWQKLIGRLGFDETRSKKFRLSFEMHGSPTDNLLRDCSYRMLRIRHLYKILMEIGLVHVAEEYLSEYDTEETLPPCPVPSHTSPSSNFGPQQRANSTAPFGHGLDKDIQKKGVSWMAIDTYHFSFEEIKKGTNNFSSNVELGAGAFGKVYKVVLNNTLFACKVLKIDSENPLTTSIIETHRQHDDLRNELNYLAEYRHPNVIALYGWSLDGPDPCLIYDYMKNGSLQDRLQCLNGSKPMQWDIRVKVSCGAARGLQFLHTMKSKPLIHGDIKTANILLDHSYTAKLGDFGLAREMPRNATTGSYIRLGNEHTPGTLGYLANEYITTKKLSVQVDTYAFGVVLLELYTGRRAYDRNKDTPLLRDYLHNIADEAEDIGEERSNEMLMELIDPQIAKLPPEIALRFVKLSLSCCHEKRKERPKMADTLSILEQINRSLSTSCGKELDDFLPPLTDGGSTQSMGIPLRSLESGYPNYNDPSLADLRSLRRGPVESVDHSLLAGSIPSQTSGKSRKSSTVSLERQFEQIRLNRPSSSDESDSQGRSSTETTYSGFYVTGMQGGATCDMGFQLPQYGYYPSPFISGGAVVHHPSQYQPPANVRAPYNPHGDRNSVPPNEDNDLYGAGPYSCPAQHSKRTNLENPYNLDLSRTQKPSCTCNAAPPPTLPSPLQASPWVGQIECVPDTFTSIDLDGKQKPGQLGEGQSVRGHDLSIAADMAGPSSERGHDPIDSRPMVPQAGSFHFQNSNPPLSITPAKESLIEKLKENSSYTQIFGRSQRQPTEGVYDNAVP